MEENVFTNMTGDTLTVQQYVDTFRRSEHIEPERLLVSAILEDAIQEYRKYSRTYSAKGKRRFREAEEWIMYDGNDCDWIFSFDNVCNFLGLDPEYIRHRVSQGKSAREKKPVHRDRMRRWAA